MSEPVIIECGACGARNRVPLEKLKDGPICGKCRTALQIGGAPLAVGDADFQQVVLGSPLPVLVDFWAQWCGPCKALAPAIEELARSRAGRVLFAKVNVDESPYAASRFGIKAVPTLVVFARGLEVDRRVGAPPIPELEEMLRRAEEMGNAGT